MGSPARRPGNQATVSAPGLLTATQSYSISNYQGLGGGGGIGGSSDSSPGDGSQEGASRRKDPKKRQEQKRGSKGRKAFRFSAPS